MKNLSKVLSATLVLLLMLSTSFVFANTTVTYKGAVEFSSDNESANNLYDSTSSNENALLISGGVSKITDPTITKSGDADSEVADFYGTNAAVLAYNHATLNLSGSHSTIFTNGNYANGVFAFGSGTINIEDVQIKTSSDNSGGIMVAGGGVINAKKLAVSTFGNSSAAIRSDRGGGTIIVDGGNYTSNGSGSPAIYSTADITVNSANLTSTKSEGVVIEGANKVTLNNSILEDNNTVLHGNSDTYKNIFIYQSQSGDAAEGTGYFSSKDGLITTKNGDVFYVTNTNAEIKLENNNFVTNNNGNLLNVEGAKWGKVGENGGNVTFTAVNQVLKGNIILDNISTLNMNITQSSHYTGTLNGSNTAKKVELTLDGNSTFTLTGDTYVTTLNNSVKDNSNIDLNGYTLHIGEEPVSSSSNAATITQVREQNQPQTITTTPERPNMTLFYALGVILVLIVALIVIYFIAVRQKRKGKRKIKEAKKFSKK